MTVTRDHIVQILDQYLYEHPAERVGLAQLASAMGADSDLWCRSTQPGHVTCGAAVIDAAGRVLMIRHRVLGKWLLPGGHLEAGDSTLRAGALRELEEETGVRWRQGTNPASAAINLLDIDLHAIPANPEKDEPAHWHADFRYAFRLDSPHIRLQLDEVCDFAWRTPADLPTARLATKVSRLTA